MTDILIQRALRTLLEGPCPTNEFVERVVGSDRKDFKKPNLTALGPRLRKNDLVRVLDGKYYITEAGRVMSGVGSNVRASSTSKMAGEYTCPELGQTCLREGAYDFLKIPSVFGQMRKPYQFKSGVN